MSYHDPIGTGHEGKVVGFLFAGLFVAYLWSMTAGLVLLGIAFYYFQKDLK